MDRRPVRTAALGVVALLAAACGGGTASVRTTTTTTRPATVPAGLQAVTAGHLRFDLPASWTIGYGACRCSWGTPDTATLNNGAEEGGVACNCPMESSTAPSGLHLYEGQGGLISAGTPTEVGGGRALVELDSSTAVLTATFPGVDQWMIIGPGPSSASTGITRQQMAQEKQILATVEVLPGGGGPP